MPTNLEIIGINERSGLVTPNLYKQNWTTPNNTTDNYSVLHTRALSDTTTPIYGKGTGLFLDTSNGGGDYDINGSVNYAGSGRLNAILINTASWSYGPATPYSVINTRALSDTTTPIYGKGTGLFLDTANGGGSYDINGNIDYIGSGRLNAIGINTAQWSYGPTTPYSVINTRALSDATTPIYGKGTGLFLDTANGGGSYDINGNQTNFPGSGRVPLMNYNFAIWTFGPSNNYTMSHPHALYPSIIPTAASILGAGDVLGKGTNDGMGVDGTLVAHTNYVGGSWDDIISRDRNIQLFGNYFWVNVLNPVDTTNWYTMSHANALAPPAPLPTAASILGAGDVKGKGTNDGMGLDGTLVAHTNYGGGSWDDIISRQRNIFNFGNVFWVSGSEYDMNHPHAQADGDVHGKGTNDPVLLDVSNSFVLPAHINYAGGSSDDIAARNINITNPFNYYKVDIANPLGTTYAYTALHPNAKAPTTIPNASDLLVSEGVLSGDTKGKGTGDPNSVNAASEFVLPAHTNYAGGSYDDIISRKRSMYSFGNLYWVSNVSGSLSSEYNVLHGNALRPPLIPSASDILGAGDNKGKGTNSGSALGVDGTLPAHTDYTGGSWDDIISRERSMYSFGNLYWVGTSEYNTSNPNALAGADDKGKGTGDGMYIDGTYAAHMNYAGGSITDRNGNQTLYPGSGRIKSNSTNEATVPTTVTVSTAGLVTVTGNKPFGYGFTTSADYETNKPVCSNAGNTINVGSIKW
jgi:hypothetical protein